MEFERPQIVDFMNRYFRAYSTVAQNPETTNEMHAFYSPDFKVTLFFPQRVVLNREQFLLVSSSHPHILETLIPEHIIADDEVAMAAALIRGELTVKETSEVILQMMFIAHYQLISDENKTMKIKDLWISAENMPPGQPDIASLYEDAFKQLQ